MPPGLSWVCQKLKRTIHPQEPSNQIVPVKHFLFKLSVLSPSALRRGPLLWSNPPEFYFQPHERHIISSCLQSFSFSSAAVVKRWWHRAEDEERTENLSVHCIKWQNRHMSSRPGRGCNEDQPLNFKYKNGVPCRWFLWLIIKVFKNISPSLNKDSRETSRSTVNQQHPNDPHTEV